MSKFSEQVLEPELPRTSGESNPRPRDCEGRRANHEATSKAHFVSRKIARRRSALTPTVFAHRPRQSPQRVARANQKSYKVLSFCTSATPIPAEGRAGTSKNVKTIRSFCTLATPIPAEGRAGTSKIVKKSPVFGHRPRQSPQRVSFSQGGFGPTAPPEETN